MAFRRLWILNVDFYVIIFLVIYDCMIVKSVKRRPTFDLVNTSKYFLFTLFQVNFEMCFEKCRCCSCMIV